MAHVVRLKRLLTHLAETTGSKKLTIEFDDVLALVVDYIAN